MRKHQVCLALLALGLWVLAYFRVWPKFDPPSALDRPVHNFTLTDVPCEVALDRLAKETGVQIDVDWETTERPANVSLDIRDGSVREALNAIVSLSNSSNADHEYVYVVNGSRLRIENEQSAEVAQIYDLRDLGKKPVHYPDQPGVDVQTVNYLEFISRLVAPSNNAAAQPTVSFHTEEGLNFVTESRYNHARITDGLRKMREANKERE